MCKPAMAATHVDCHCTRDIDLELFDRMLQFHASARYPRVYLLTLETKGRVLSNFDGGTIYSYAAVRDNSACHYQRCGMLGIVSKALFDEQLVYSSFLCLLLLLTAPLCVYLACGRCN